MASDLHASVSLYYKYALLHMDLEDATPKSVLPDNFKRITDYLLDLKPPKFPFPIDDAKAARGSAVFGRACASCHAMGSKQIGQVVDIMEVGTDRYRLDSVTTPLIGERNVVLSICA